MNLLTDIFGEAVTLKGKLMSDSAPVRLIFLKEFRDLADQIFGNELYSVIETEDITAQYKPLLEAKPSTSIIFQRKIFDVQTLRGTRALYKKESIPHGFDDEGKQVYLDINYLTMDYQDKEYGEIHRFIAAKKGHLSKLLSWACHKARQEIQKPILASEIYDKTIGSVIKFLLHRKKLKKLGVSYNKGILLCGEPGNGKTMITNYIKKYVESRGMYVSILSLNEIRQGRPMNGDVIILDDFSIDPLINRTPESDYILSEMDGPNKDFGRVYLITTNELNEKDKLLPELVRPGRIDTVVKLTKPTKSLRLEYVNNWKIALTEGQRTEIANLSVNFSFAQLNRLQTELAMMQIEGKAFDLTKAFGIVEQKIGDKVKEPLPYSQNRLGFATLPGIVEEEGDE